MSFVMPKGAKTFFQSIPTIREGVTKFIMFDQYYACMMVGLDARRIAPEEELDGDVFLNAYPEDYRAQADIIAGLLIDAELVRKGIGPEDKDSIEREMISLLNPTSPTRLSTDGNLLLNRYAAEGFRIVRDTMLAPANLEEFLVAYFRWWHSQSVA